VRLGTKKINAGSPPQGLSRGVEFRRSIEAPLERLVPGFVVAGPGKFFENIFGAEKILKKILGESAEIFLLMS
jgi:hypothetical protein